MILGNIFAAFHEHGIGYKKSERAYAELRLIAGFPQKKRGRGAVGVEQIDVARVMAAVLLRDVDLMRDQELRNQKIHEAHVLLAAAQNGKPAPLKLEPHGPMQESRLLPASLVSYLAAILHGEVGTWRSNATGMIANEAE
jgi:hypothetical protein